MSDMIRAIQLIFGELLSIIKDGFIRLCMDKSAWNVRKMIRTKTLKDLIDIQPIAIMQVRKANFNIAGRRMPLSLYVENNLGTNVEPERAKLLFSKPPQPDSWVSPKYALYLVINDYCIDTQLIVTADAATKEAVLIHKYEFYGYMGVNGNGSQFHQEQYSLSRL